MVKGSRCPLTPFSRCSCKSAQFSVGLCRPPCAAMATIKLRDLVVDCVCACLYSGVTKCVYVYSSHLSTPRSIWLFLPFCPSRGFCRCVQALFDASARQRAFLGATGDVYITKTLHVNSASSEREKMWSACGGGKEVTSGVQQLKPFIDYQIQLQGEQDWAKLPWRSRVFDKLNTD